MRRISQYLASLIPTGFLWRLSVLNVVVLVAATALSGWAIYNTACFLAAGVGALDAEKQQQFNSTLLNYLWIFMIVAALFGSVFHFYLTKHLIGPIRELIKSTKKMQKGHYPKPVAVTGNDEVSQLVEQYNRLLAQLQNNEVHREKMIHDLSHEIRTPLANLNGYLQALKDGDLDGDIELFAALYKESNRMTKMVEQLDQLTEWDYLKEQVIVEKTPCDISDLLKQCVAIFERTLAQENIAIQVEVEPYEIPLHVEGLQQVMSNLIENGIQYYEGEGPIIISGKKQTQGYIVSVKGPGQPIPEQEKENIFRRFYRLDDSRSRMTGGSGLGLAISKEIIERHHHGEIGVEVSEGQNEFWFMLPDN